MAKLYSILAVAVEI